MAERSLRTAWRTTAGTQVDQGAPQCPPTHGAEMNFGKVREQWACRLFVHNWHRLRGHMSSKKVYHPHPQGMQELESELRRGLCIPSSALLPLPNPCAADHWTGITKLKQVFDTTNLISPCYEKSHRAVFISQAQHSEQTRCCNL